MSSEMGFLSTWNPVGCQPDKTSLAVAGAELTPPAPGASSDSADFTFLLEAFREKSVLGNME